MNDDAITVLCYDRDGRLLDTIPDVSLGDRRKAAAEGRESLHSASLWAIVATKAVARDTPPEG